MKEQEPALQMFRRLPEKQKCSSNSSRNSATEAVGTAGETATNQQIVTRETTQKIPAVQYLKTSTKLL